MNLHIMGDLESVRFFPDSPDSKPPFVGHRHVTFGGEQYHGLIKEMQAHGAGAYFSVNRTDGVGAKAENIVGVRTYYVDIDGLKDKTPALSKLIIAKLKPSAIVETKNGVHAYWYAAIRSPVDYHQYKRVQTGLCDAFGGDRSARDIARVLRIPGTLHLKDPSDPFTVRIVHQLSKDETPYYAAEELLAAFPSPEVKDNFPTITPQNNPQAWEWFIEDLSKWEPVPGERNMVMLLSAGVAIAYGVTLESYLATMYDVAKDWGTGRDVRGELNRVGRWAYSRGNPIPAHALRKRGVPLRRGL